LKRQQVANAAWGRDAAAKVEADGGCNADFIPTQAYGSRGLGGCVSVFGRATEGGSD
jgi:hypothetical protein